MDKDRHSKRDSIGLRACGCPGYRSVQLRMGYQYDARDIWIYVKRWKEGRWRNERGFGRPCEATIYISYGYIEALAIVVYQWPEEVGKEKKYIKYEATNKMRDDHIYFLPVYRGPDYRSVRPRRCSECWWNPTCGAQLLALRGILSPPTTYNKKGELKLMVIEIVFCVQKVMIRRAFSYGAPLITP